MQYKIDHFAVGADTLEQGVKAMQATLGVELSVGSKHDLMSTHNKVMQSGNESFFELIAIDPDAPTPSRTRWFTLDDPTTHKRVAERPRALCWVVGTDDLDAVVAASPRELGEIVTFTRGDRSWRLTVPADGHLPGGGLLPAFIEWSPGPHPSTAHQDLGVTLQSVNLSHPNSESFIKLLQALNVDHLATVTQGDAALSFTLATANGVITID
ncbi:MAG: VOC family protein [Granulosicoccaceae bacterium]